jgi:hypothetical protein
MSMRALTFVAAALIILSGIAYFASDRPAPGEQRDSIFVPALGTELNDIDTIVIRSAGNEPRVTLQRAAAGWSVTERDGYRADTGKIRAALTALAEAKIVEAKTANPDLHVRLGVSDIEEEDARGIMVSFLPESLGLQSLLLGDPEGSGYRYARRADDNQSYLIDANPEFPTNAAEWVVPTILDVRGARVERVVIQHTDGEQLVLFKDNVEQPNYSVSDVPTGRELQYPGVANVIANALRELRLEDVAAASPADPATEVVTEFETFDGLIVRAEGIRIDDEGWLQFSARLDEQFGSPDETVANEAESINAVVTGWRYRIPSYQYDQIARRMSDLLRAEDASD